MSIILAALHLRLFQRTTESSKKFLYFPLSSSGFCVCNFSFNSLVSSKMDSFSKFGLYRNLKEILADLAQHEDKQQVQQLLQVYKNAKIKYEKQGDSKKHPLIVLEGLDGSGKTSMTKQLAKKFKAQRWLTPPESVRFLRDYFDNDSGLRTAYYSLGNYIAALEVLCVLPEQPVVMDRFWHSTTAYALAQGVADRALELELPSPSDAIYKWPEDLLKPDKVMFLNVSEEVRLERHSRRSAALVTTQENLLKDNEKFRRDVIQAYKNMRDPEVTIVNCDGKFGVVLYHLKNNVQSLLEK